MSMRLADICAAIAQEANAILPSVYPAPNAGAVSTPLLIVFSGEGRRERGMGEQFFHHTIRGRILAAPTDVPSAMRSVDERLEALADHFDADNDDAFHLRNFAPGKSVDFCEVVEWSLSNVVNLAGHDYLGGDVFFRVKVRRQRNDL